MSTRSLPFRFSGSLGQWGDGPRRVDLQPELEVFEPITRGLSNAEIGGELFISDTTVKPTSPGCCRSWTSATGVQAIILAYKPGLFD
ncbi:MAG: LuxR C-terminal-related transcriptional regulator [Jiangellaceae bacterium]